MTPKQAAEALAKARDLNRRAEHNRRTADKMPGTKSAKAADDRADDQSKKAEALFDALADYLARTA